jgi:hypothetical protein
MTKDSAKFLKVTDTSCTAESGDRVHDCFVRGVLTPTVFKYGVDTVLPYEHGIKFNLPGFNLFDADGQPLAIPAVTKESIRDSLAAGEVVAKLTELTLSSLKIRAAQKKGGEIYLDADDASRVDLIDFIMGTPPVAEVSHETIDGEDDLVDHEGDDDEHSVVSVSPAAPAPETPFEWKPEADEADEEEAA